MGNITMKRSGMEIDFNGIEKSKVLDRFTTISENIIATVIMGNIAVIF